MSHFPLTKQRTVYSLPLKMQKRLRRNKSLLQGQCLPYSMDKVRCTQLLRDLSNQIINLQRVICVAENTEHKTVFHVANNFIVC
jgi:hypothetical protein